MNYNPDGRVSFSTLKHIARSPAHYRANLARPFTPSRSMRIGKACDAILFGRPDSLAIHDGQRRGKEWERLTVIERREIVTRDEWDVGDACASAVAKNPRAMELLDGERWAAIEWQSHGVGLISHPDVIGRGFVTDLKTTVSSQPRAFVRDALKFRYHAQLAMYAAAVVHRALVPGATVGHPTLHIVAVENTEPHPVTVFTLTDAAILAGAKMYSGWLETLKVCLASDTWPGYSTADVELDVADDFELTFGEEAES